MVDDKRGDKTEVLGAPDTGRQPRLGRYRLERKIGQGGMADIFLAVADGPAGFEKQVVIKKIRAQLGRNHKFVEMFLREARLLATLQHENVVRIFELGEDDGEYFLALEYLQGLSLRDIADRWWHAKRTLPIEALLKIVADAARGLEHAHAFKDARGHPANLVHRDVSPDNLFVTTVGVTKLLDFGIAKREGIDMLTQAGEIKGKIPFMSPEALQGHPLDRRCDIWSLGVVLYWLMSGHRPFEGTSDLHTMKAILEDEPRPLREVNRHVPQALEAVVMSCLVKDREHRMKSAGELSSALQHLIAGVSSGAPQPQLLVEVALKLPGVDYEVKPKVVPAVPVASWPERDAQERPLLSLDNEPEPLERHRLHDAPTHNPAPPPPRAPSASGAQPDVGGQGFDTSTERFDVSTESEVLRDKEPEWLDGGPPTAPQAFEPPSSPVIDVERRALGEHSTPLAQADGPPTLPTARPPSAPQTDSTGDGRASPGGPWALPGPAAEFDERALRDAVAPPRPGLAIVLGVASALVLMFGVVAWLGLVDELRDLLVPPAQTDAGVLTVNDAGMVAAEADAGPAAVADAGVRAPVDEPRRRTLQLSAPASIEWRDRDGDVLLVGKGTVQVPATDDVVLAVDARRACTARVPLGARGGLDYLALPKGRLMVKAKKGTELFLGAERIGVAPMRREIDVVVGTCELRARSKGVDKKLPVEITAGRTSTITVR